MFEEECNNRFRKHGFDMIHFLGLEEIHTCDDLVDADLTDLLAKAKLRKIKKNQILKLKKWVNELLGLEEDELPPISEEMNRTDSQDV